MDNEKWAIATVCDKNFIRGTQTLFHSILHHNKNFQGDLIIICEEGFRKYEQLFNMFDHVTLHIVSESLKSAALKAVNSIRGRAGSHKLWYCLESFNLKGYDKILFLDSDIICSGEMISLLEEVTTEEICAGHDRAWFIDKVRSHDTFELLDPDANDRNIRTISPTFNSGVMLIDGSFIDKGIYFDLIENINTIPWSHTNGLNDQVIINQFFEGQIKPLSPRYNFITKLKNEIFSKSKVVMDDASFLHFVGAPKPWYFVGYIKQLIRHQSNQFPVGHKLWIEAYLRFLKEHAYNMPLYLCLNILKRIIK